MHDGPATVIREWSWLRTAPIEPGGQRRQEATLLRNTPCPARWWALSNRFAFSLRSLSAPNSPDDDVLLGSPSPAERLGLSKEMYAKFDLTWQEKTLSPHAWTRCRGFSAMTPNILQQWLYVWRDRGRDMCNDRTAYMSWTLQLDEKAIGRHPVVNRSRQESRTEQKKCPTARTCRDHQAGWFEVSRLTNTVLS